MRHTSRADGGLSHRSGTDPTGLQVIMTAAVTLALLIGRRSAGTGHAGTAPEATGRAHRDRSRPAAHEKTWHDGRTAERPTEIPPHGWWVVARRVWKEVGEDKMTLVAAGCAFYALLALFPAITAIVSVYGLVSDPAMVEQQVARLGEFVPSQVVQLVTTQAHEVAAAGSSRLSTSAALALLFALYTATSGIKALFEALNIAYEEKEDRGLVRLNLVAFGITVGIVIGIALMIAVIVGVPVVLGYLPLGPLGGWAVRIGSWLLLFVFILIGVSTLYRFGPSRAPARWWWVTPGSLAATVLWLAGSLGFSFYVANFADYNGTYGALGGVVVLLLWLFISAFSLLLGAELNAELELQTRRDTTTGAPEPMGHRQAMVADTTADRRPSAGSTSAPETGF